MSWAEENSIDLYDPDEYEYIQQMLESYDEELIKCVKELLKIKELRKARYRDLVENICNFDGELSKKQRWCLVKFIYDYDHLFWS